MPDALEDREVAPEHVGLGTPTNSERQESTEYHWVVLFGRTAEVAEQFAVKGRAVYVEGRLRTCDFTDSDGNCRFSTEVIADSVKLPAPPTATRADGTATTAPEPDAEPVTAHRRTNRGKAA